MTIRLGKYSINSRECMKTDSNKFIQLVICIVVSFVLGFVLCRSMVHVEDVADRGSRYEVVVSIWGLCDLHEVEKL